MALKYVFASDPQILLVNDEVYGVDKLCQVSSKSVDVLGVPSPFDFSKRFEWDFCENSAPWRYRPPRSS